MKFFIFHLNNWLLNNYNICCEIIEQFSEFLFQFYHKCSGPEVGHQNEDDTEPALQPEGNSPATFSSLFRKFIISYKRLQFCENVFRLFIAGNYRVLL